MVCLTCGLQKPTVDKQGVCSDCKKVARARDRSLQKQNYNWLEMAKENEIELWERQPGETDFDCKMWMIYRDMYPMKKPTYSAVAETLGVERSSVVNVGAKWSFPTRMQAWVKHTDELLLKNRQQDIVDMNAKHVSMAMRINEKLEIAIDNIDAYTLKPGELSGLMKMSTELERKARLDVTSVDAPDTTDGKNPNLKNTETKTDDIGEILKILQQTGMLGQLGIGVKQTTTTEVVVKGEE